MAGPIRDLIARMRENRQQRLEDGTALFPALGSMRERGGNRIGLLRRFRSQEKPAADATPTQPATSEPLPAPGESTTKASGPAVRTASGPSMQATLNPPPVQGGTNSLPDPEQFYLDAVSDLKRPFTTKDEFAQRQSVAAAAKGRYEMSLNRQAANEAASRQTFEYNMGEVGKAAQLAARDGNWSVYEQTLLSSALVPKTNEGKPVGNVDFAGIARPAANNAIFASLKMGPSNLSPQDMAVLKTNIAYAYPVSFGVSRDGTPVPPDKVSAQKAVDIMYKDLNQQFNPKGDKANASILKGLAIEIVHEKARRMGFQGQVFSRKMVMPTPSPSEVNRSDF